VQESEQFKFCVVKRSVQYPRG